MPTKSPSPESLKLVKDYSRQAAVFAVARVPGKTTCYFGSSDFKVSVGDFAAAKFEPRDLYAHGSYVTGVALAGTTLVSGAYDGKLTWWDTEEDETIRTVDAHGKWVRKVVASPDGKLVVSVADDMACKVWDAATGRLVHDLRGHKEKTPTHFTSMLYTAAFSADGKLLATADKVGHVVVWDVAAGKEIGSVEAPVMYTWDPVQRMHSIGGIRSVAFSPDGNLLAVGGTGKIGNIDHLEAKARVEVFDWKAKKQVAEFVADKSQGIVNKLQFAPDGSWLLGAGGAGEGFFVFMDVAGKKITKQEKVPMHVHDFAMSETADAVYAVGHNKVAAYKLG
ncbi:WD40 repeat domain-containing protein [Fimbriiglobus ruber]|uniref:WD-repeat protein n=1 Tax=Fimbriiglobus ruber TaxID=1908690 RepID=A0A225DC35_9BACT|nr:PQQ-binding-like beta-propeller repeat protein [Fimbriiglobus ruber]OWK39042.1 WD-repeat protein [Fimbriiglobus ruber]